MERNKGIWRKKKEVRAEKQNREQSILDIITEHAANERLDALLRDDKEFIKLQGKIEEASCELDRLGLTREQRSAVDGMVSAYTASAAYYSLAAYRQGFRDCGTMFIEIVPDKICHLQKEGGESEQQFT